MIKNFKYFFEAIIVYFFFLIGKLLGLNASSKLFSFVFKKIGFLFKSNKIINENLNRFSKNISKNEKRKIINDMWSNYGITFIEYIFLNIFRDEKKYVKFENETIIKKVIKNKMPVIFISGHFANFEIMSMELTKMNIKLATIYRPLNNIFLNFFMEFLRKKYICKNQIKKGRAGVKNAVKFINNNYSIALMIDQRVSEGEIVNLFNQPALTTTLPSQLSLKYKLNIVPISIKRFKTNYFKIKFHKPIQSSLYKSKSKLTKRLNLELEKMIVKNPNQWIWTHNRWKL